MSTQSNFSIDTISSTLNSNLRAHKAKHGTFDDYDFKDFSKKVKALAEAIATKLGIELVQYTTNEKDKSVCGHFKRQDGNFIYFSTSLKTFFFNELSFRITANTNNGDGKDFKGYEHLCDLVRFADQLQAKLNNPVGG